MALELKRMGLGAEALGVFSASIVAMQIGMITLTPRRPAPAEVVPVGATA